VTGQNTKPQTGRNSADPKRHMSQSLAQVLLHIVFSTKNRTPFFSRPELREAMNGYLVGTLRNLDCLSIIVNCVEDHVHCLCLKTFSPGYVIDPNGVYHGWGWGVFVMPFEESGPYYNEISGGV